MTKKAQPKQQQGETATRKNSLSTEATRRSSARSSIASTQTLNDSFVDQHSGWSPVAEPRKTIYSDLMENCPADLFD